MKALFFLASLILLTSSLSFAEELVVRYNPSMSEKDFRSAYFVSLLGLALEKTRATYGPFRLEKGKESMFQSRAIRELHKGQRIDVFWTMTSVERENQLLPIRIPLLKGLLGYRIFIIRQEDETKFRTITDINEFKELVAGQGTDWPDTKILRANNINVVTSPVYDGLFMMLHKKRFDYFPRGITEIWQEVEFHHDKELIVESSKILYYPAPIYFFVSPQNNALANRIEKGLALARLDGSFDRLFYSYPAHQKIFDRGKLEHRQVIILDNPLLPEHTPLDKKELWLELIPLSEN